MPCVRQKPEESFESLWRRFRRTVEKHNLLATVRRKMHYEKPSQQRKREKQAAIKREMRRQEKDSRFMADAARRGRDRGVGRVNGSSSGSSSRASRDDRSM